MKTASKIRMRCSANVVLLVAALLITLLVGCDTHGEGSGGKPTGGLSKGTHSPVTKFEIDWLINELRSSQSITITARDSPDIQVPVDLQIRERLVEATVSELSVSSFGSEWLNPYVPFPEYELRMESSSDDILILGWWGTQRFSVTWNSAKEDEDITRAYFYQEDSKLWETIASLASPPHYADTDIRHLLQANSLQAVLGQEQFHLGKRNPFILRVARALVKGRPSDKAVPSDEPSGLLEFDIDSSRYEVKLWQDDFTYNRQLYHLADVYTTVRLTLSTP